MRGKSGGHHYQWTAQPPRKERTQLPLVRVRAGRVVQAVCVSEQVEGLLVHFLAGRTRACVGASEGCEGCEAGWNPRWKGYLAVFFPQHSQRVYLLELTQRAFETLKASSPTMFDYRRQWIQVERASGRPNAAVKANVISRPRYEGDLPELPDVREAIAYILEAPDRSVLGSVNETTKTTDKGEKS